MEQALLTQAVDYYLTAQDYEGSRNLLGALVYYKLSANNIHLLKTNTSGKQSLVALYKSGKSPRLQEWCDSQDCRSFDQVLELLLRKILPLQQEAKNLLSAKGGDSEEVSCKDIQAVVFGEGSKDCIFFADIAGLEDVKEKLINGFVNPLMYPHLYPDSSKGILFYGPPGTGKSLIAKAALNELQIRDPNVRVLFYVAMGADLKGKYVGETEKNIKRYFDCASREATRVKKECSSPGVDLQVRSIIFIDEVDSIAGDRGKDQSGMMSNSVNALLQVMDGISSADNVAVMAATNFPWRLDSAFLRRFDTKLLIDLPNETSLTSLLEIDLNRYIKRAIVKPKKDSIKPLKGTCTVSGCRPIKKSQAKELYEEHTTLTKSDIQNLAKTISQNYFYSGSDTSKMVKRALTYAADRARANNLFVSRIIDGNQIFVSTLSVNLKADDNLVALAVPNPPVITLEGQRFLDSTVAMIKYPRMIEILKAIDMGQIERLFLSETDLAAGKPTITVIVPVTISATYKQAEHDDMIDNPTLYLVTTFDQQLSYFQSTKKLISSFFTSGGTTAYVAGNNTFEYLIDTKRLIGVVVKGARDNNYYQLPFKTLIGATKTSLGSTIKTRQDVFERDCWVNGISYLHSLVACMDGETSKPTVVKFAPVDEDVAFDILGPRVRQNAITFDLRLDDFTKALVSEKVKTISTEDRKKLIDYSQGKEVPE